MASLKLRLTLVAVALAVAALALGWFAPWIIARVEEEIRFEHLLLAAFVFIGLCGVAYYTLLERAINPVMVLMETFSRMRAGDMNPRLPVEGPPEMCRMARSFNDMVEDLELQIRDIELEKQEAERARDFIQEQLEASHKFKSMVDGAPVGVILTDLAQSVVYMNAFAESGFLQMEGLLPFGNGSARGQDITTLYDDPGHARKVLSDPDHLPYEDTVNVGPHRLRFLASAVYDAEEDFAGTMILWEIDETEAADGLPDEEDAAFEIDEDDAAFESLLEGSDFDTSEVVPVDPDGGIDEDLLAEVEALGTAVDDDGLEEGFELIDDLESDADAGAVTPNGANVPAVPGASQEERTSLARSASLVSRSVRVLGERLGDIVSSVDALCSEGDNLHQALEEVREHVRNAGHLTAERSESLWELVSEMDAAVERSQTSAALIKRFRKSLEESRALSTQVSRLEGAIEQMVLASRIELGKSEGDAAGLRAVVDAVEELSGQTVSLREEVEARVARLREDAEEVTNVLEEGQRDAKTAGKLTRRAEGALGRIERDLSDAATRNDLLLEMAEGQSEIGGHIARRVRELAELVQVTVRVADEQVRLTSGDGGGGEAVSRET